LIPMLPDWKIPFLPPYMRSRSSFFTC
jgi:hypothetical protein